MAHEVTLPGGYVVSDDKGRLDLDLVHRYLSEESYWATGRSREMVERTIAGSLCVGAYGPDSAQVGFARVITDRALFAWMADVFVLPAARGQKLGRVMVETLLGHPELAHVQRWMLVTSDANGLYESYGFSWVTEDDRLMKRVGRHPAGRVENPPRTP